VKVVIAGGGTGGHVFPALALAERLARDGGAQVRFIGSATGPEARHVPAAGFRFDAIEAAPLLRKLSVTTLKAPIIALRSIRASGSLVRGADVVVGMGGYVSAPVVVAARLARIPIVLHEPNAVPGLANRISARWAAVVAVQFEAARRRLQGYTPRHRRVEVVGYPVRAAIRAVATAGDDLREEACAALELDPKGVTALVFGGSQGARHIDETVAAALPLLSGREDLQLLVLTGHAHLETVAEAAGRATRLRVRVLPFLERMELAYAAADLAVARAGATSIAELTVCGLPSILIPYPYATEDHQEANARELERVGAARVLLDRELSAETLVRSLLELVDNEELRRRMGERASAWSKPDADARLAALVAEVARP
jgi:UDP-N-acetylglucosamine--N-acetylmuramyl-(pentapeptide) pyrophosphoryl-undecaprenol N-acetylglucosamine transferase